MPKKTIYNGDIISGIPVITELNVNDLSHGQVHRFMFKGVDMNIGQSWYVPVLVAVGIKPGAKLLLNTGIHGDELNGSRVIHKVFNQLDPMQLSGVVMGVMQSNPNALLHIHRLWHLSTDGGDYVNLNRVFPGNEEGNAAQIHAHKLWNNLWEGNVNWVIDLHTQMTDEEFPVLIYADYNIPYVQQLAELIPADLIKVDSPQHTSLDNGESLGGALENVFNAHKIPAITLELGGARSYQQPAIESALKGIRNIMIDKKMIVGNISATAASVNTYIGHEMIDVKAKAGGYTEILVKLLQRVNPGDRLATQYNPFGDVMAEYVSPVKGVIASIATGVTREPGSTLVYILS